MKRILSLLLLGLFCGGVLAAENVAAPVPGTDRVANAQSGSGNHPGAGGCGLMQYGAILHSGGLSLWDAPMSYQPEYGPWIPCLVHWVQGAESRSGMHMGGFGVSASAYVSTVEAVPEMSRRGLVQVNLLSGGYETHKATEERACASDRAMNCTYAKSLYGQAELLRWGGNEGARAGVPSSLLSDARGFVRKSIDGSYEVYGGTANAIRLVRSSDGAVSGYEAWLSAKVDRQGLVLQVIYDERMRISQLWDATIRLNWEGVPDARQGGVTRFFYPDTDPRWSLEQRNQHRELEARDISAAGAALNLLTSVVDPYGRRVQFDYQDMLTGLMLGDDSTDLVRQNSRYWRLVATQDVLNVRSSIRYACGFSSLAVSDVEVFDRRNQLSRAGCLDARGAQIASDWNLVRETQTPYGTTRYTRINRTDSRGRGMKGWMVTTPNGLVERWETLMGTAEGDLLAEITRPRPNGQGQLEPLIQSRNLTRPAHIPASAWPSGLGELSVYHRLSFHWSPKAMSVGPSRLVSDPSYAVGVLPPLETATIRQYLEDVAPGSSELAMSPWVMAEKGPLTGWVYYYREGQAAVDRLRNSGEVTTRALPSPSIVARVLDNGQVQASYVQYNAAGDARYVVDPQGRATELEYTGRDVSAVYQVAWNAGAPMRLALLGRYSYNSLGQITGQYGVGPDEWVRYKYDRQAPYVLLSKTYPSDTDGGTRSTSYVWSEENSVSLAKRLTRLTVTDADGLSAVSEYKGGVLIARRSQGIEERWWGHDAFGRPRSYSLVQSDGSTREHVGYEYEGLELRAIRNALDGSRTQITPDHLGRPQHIQHLAADGSLLQEWWREYDPSGGVSALRGPTVADLSGVLFDYDLMGRVIQRTEPDSSTIRISYERSHSRIHSVTDARNISTYLEYDLSDALLNKRIRNPMAEPVMRLVYDTHYSRVNRQSDALGTTTYHYTDATHPYRVTQIDEPLAGASAMDAARETRTVPSYDSLGRLRAWQLTDNNSTLARSWMQTEFNAQGLIARYSNEIFSAIPRYDLVQESVGLYGDLNAVDYQLEAGAALPEMILSITRTGVDEERKLRSLNYQTVDGNLGSTLHYDGQGRIDRVEGLIGNGIHNYRYDGLSQLKQSAHWRNTPGGMEHVSTTGYTYDSKGNREGLIEQNAAGVDVAPIVSTSYSGYNLDAYQLRTDPSRNAQHDAAGNITYNPSNQQSYVWDDEGRLSRIIYPSKWGKPDNYTQFTYDAQRRIRRIQEVQYGDSIEDMTYVWVGNQLVQKRDTASQRIVQTYNNDGYTDIAADGSVSKYILLRNHQSSVIGKTNLQGQVLERIDYTPEGKIQNRQTRDSSGTLTSASAASDLPFGYAGYWQHQRSGLSITKFRFYDPALARWLSKDPIRELGGFNPYAYVGNNITNFTDPTGLYSYTDAIQQWRASGGDRWEFPVEGDCPSFVRLLISERAIQQQIRRDIALDYRALYGHEMDREGWSYMLYGFVLNRGEFSEGLSERLEEFEHSVGRINALQAYIRDNCRTGDHQAANDNAIPEPSNDNATARSGQARESLDSPMDPMECYGLDGCHQSPEQALHGMEVFVSGLAVMTGVGTIATAYEAGGVFAALGRLASLF